MNARIICASLCAVVALAACAQNSGTDAAGTGSGSREAGATLRDAEGRVRAEARATQDGEGVKIRLTATQMTPGAYGAHVHTTGRCDAPDFASAGPHWNPTAQQHGKDNPQGAHKGDLPNLLVGTDGRGTVEFTIPSASLQGGDVSILDADGAAVMIHASADDYRTDPSGNSGARIACGVLG